MMILDKVNSPSDLKKLSINEMETLASEMREAIINRVNLVSGHLGPDLGIVETTIAMHYVFNSPVDKFVFDVSHQCYTHKMLTGRKRGFVDPLNNMDISGYTTPFESEHDQFVVGHTSTSVSLASGLVKSRDVMGEKYNIVALIGDGSLTGGEALEGLNNAKELGTNFIIIVNDNEMSIAENHGGLYQNLADLRNSNGKCENNFFKAMGLDYIYVEQGNDVQTMINALEQVKDIDHPVVVHIHTQKGKGYEPAETNKEKFHWIMPNFLEPQEETSVVEDINSVTKDYLLNKIEQDKKVVLVTASTPGVFGFTPDYREKLGKNYMDVGIAEEHAIGLVSGMAKNGAKPVLCLMSSFIQRTYDQISQDLCLNNSPATILVYWGGISGADMTHLCTFDMAMISNIPNLVYLAPTCKEEYLRMLDWSVEQKDHPVVIRVPAGELVSTGVEDKTDYSILNKYQVVEQGSDVAIVGVGNFFELAKSVKNELKEKLNVNATLINPKFMTGVDEQLLNDLKANHKVVVTLENGELNGGFGEKIARFYGSTDMKVLNYGSFKEFVDRVPLDELLNKYRLTKEQITEDVKRVL